MTATWRRRGRLGSGNHAEHVALLGAVLAELGLALNAEISSRYRRCRAACRRRTATPPGASSPCPPSSFGYCTSSLPAAATRTLIGSSSPPRNGGPLRKTWRVRYYWLPAAKVAALDGLTFHHLRRLPNRRKRQRPRLLPPYRPPLRSHDQGPLRTLLPTVDAAAVDALDAMFDDQPDWVTQTEPRSTIVGAPYWPTPSLQTRTLACWTPVSALLDGGATRFLARCTPAPVGRHVSLSPQAGHRRDQAPDTQLSTGQSEPEDLPH